MSGCLPILVQIPVFFALYKVLFVTIEMRQMPFYGWIQDLSERDPTSLFNLFGLLPYDVPSFLVIGVWPIAMGVSMWIQQKLNPAPTDAMQAKIASLKDQGVTFKVCANTVKGKKVNVSDHLYDAVSSDIVPSGVAELSHLQQKGFTYLRP